MSVQINIEPVLLEIRGVIARLQDVVPFYDEVGNYALNKAHERIMSLKTTPDGAPWAPWRPFTETARMFKGNFSQGLLWDTGTLLNELHFYVDGNEEVVIGSSLDYAVTVQDGDGATQAPREFLGWSEYDCEVVALAAIRYFDEGFLGGLH